MNPVIIEKDVVTVADIDEAISHISILMKDQYGNRLTHQRKAFLMGELDSLLDARLEAISEFGNSSDRKSEPRSEQRETA